MRWFEAHLPATGVDASRALGHGARRACRSPARSSRELLQTLDRRTISRPRPSRFMSFREMDVGMVPGAGRPHQLHRRSRLRDLGASPTTSARSTTLLMRGAARDSACADFGMRALLNRCGSRRASAPGSREYRPIYGALRGRARTASSISRRATSSAARRRRAEQRRRPRAAPRHLRGRGRRCRRDRATSRSGTTARWSAG